ncbi:MAG: potassium/proton antiporter [Prevotellaceae bacterium]|jgi:cell volume regulation protein A|nr:potassium/proton antiporter [Prevotellaceae bacterium]
MLEFVFSDSLLLMIAILLFASVIASKASFRVGVPTLLFFMVIGMIAGSEGVGVEFDSPQAAQFIGIVALNFILFFGGFETSFSEIRPAIKSGAMLSFFGVLFTAIILGIFVWCLMPGFSLVEGLLLGSIVSSTDAAAVFAVMRSRNLGLRGNLRPMLEFESGSNDPMAYLLTITFLSMAQNPEESIWSNIPMIGVQMVVGVLMGLGLGWVGKRIINRIRLEYDALYAVLVTALMFFTYSATNLLYGNGFLAVYTSALYLGNQKLIHRKTIAKIFDGLAWIMQIAIFIVLGLLVYPSHIVPVIGVGLVISAFLMVVARPLSVFLSLLPLKIPFNRQLFVSWVGLKGAVPIVFATYPLVAGLDKADTIFNVVFLISATSVLIQGTTLSRAAKLFGVSQPFKQQRQISIDIDLTDREDVKSKFVQVTLPSTSKVLGIPLVELGLPPKVAISLIIRGNKYITPYGATTLEAHDRLLIVSEDSVGMAKALEKLEVSGQVDWE